MTRIFQTQTLSPDATIKLDERASHHLANVLRMKVGESIRVFNGQGGEYDSEITAIDKKAVTVKLITWLPNETESLLSICLAQGIARGEKMDFIVQKAIELGVKTLQPLVTERCQVRLKGEREEKRQQHWQGVITSALEQSGRAALPTLEPVKSLANWLATVKADHAFVLSPHVSKKLSLQAMPKGGKVVLLIGPEGGLTDQEVALAIAHGFSPLNLGPRILRTETATIAALAAMQAYFGDLGE